MPRPFGTSRGNKGLNIGKKLKTNQQAIQGKGLLIYSHNIGAFRHTGQGPNKIVIMNDKLVDTNFDIICIQETWLTDKVRDSEFLKHTKFVIYRKDRACFINTRGHGGGVATG